MIADALENHQMEQESVMAMEHDEHADVMAKIEDIRNIRE